MSGRGTQAWEEQACTGACQLGDSEPQAMHPSSPNVPIAFGLGSFCLVRYLSRPLVPSEPQAPRPRWGLLCSVPNDGLELGTGEHLAEPKTMTTLRLSAKQLAMQKPCTVPTAKDEGVDTTVPMQAPGRKDQLTQTQKEGTGQSLPAVDTRPSAT